MRTAAEAWQAYCADEETIAWRNLRGLVEKVQPRFDLAIDADSRIPMSYPKLTSLLSAKATIAKKGVATRRLNTKAVAEGKVPTHGTAAKQRQKAAEKAALAKVTAAATVPAAPVASVTPPTAPAVAVAAPSSSAAAAPAPAVHP